MGEKHSVSGTFTEIHFHDTGTECLAAAAVRGRNTTIAIGATGDDKGTLLIDIDVQADVCAGPAELQEQLLLVVEALDGMDLEPTE